MEERPGTNDKALAMAEGLKISGANLALIYGYFVLAFGIAFYLIYKSKVNYKFELFALCFFLLTGEANELLTFKIPGVSFFEIQPERFLFLVFAFFLLRRFAFPPSKGKKAGRIDKVVKPDWVHPWFFIALNILIGLVVGSLFLHSDQLGLSESIVQSLKPATFLVIVYSLYILADEKVITVVGKAIMIGAVFSSLICLAQASFDTMFMRVGELRIAFGDVMRSTGLFSTERVNAYFLIMALAWALITVGNKQMKFTLAGIYCLGVVSTFHRMSWLVMALVLLLYFIKIQKVGADRLIFAALTAMILILSVYTFFFQDIMNSSLVQERLADSVDGRKGYYAMVIENIGKQPVFGFGGKNNKVYYQGMLEITGQFNRATGQDGGIHSGYFSTLFYYGVPAFVFYICFVLLAVFYFLKLSRYNIFFAIPFLIAVVYGAGNLTNTLLFHGTGIFYAIHIGLGLGARYMRNFIYGEIKEFKI